LRIGFRQTGLLALVASASIIGLTACGQDLSGPTSRVFEDAPWTGPERMVYDLTERGELYGRCEMETIPNIEPGLTELNLLCGDDRGFRDDRTATVQSDTLVPVGATRVILNPEKQTRITFASAYDGDKVTFTSDDNGKVRSAERDLPTPTRESPEPGFYDDESLLWVIRGIPLRAGFEGRYTNVNAGNGQVFAVELSVLGTERVKVPAGEFDSWRIQVRTASITQMFWVDVAEPHRLVRARIERLTYELTSFE
jgi:hypothetical protein